jgi:hypothetical protein
MALQVRRGTNAERLQITPAEGELIYTVDTKQLYVGDGTTAGGNASIAGTIDSLLADSSPQLGGTLDLNNNDITGTGNINITGTIQASGNINLGDGVGSDILVIGGAIQGHLVPDVDATHHLGSPSKYWNNAWLNQLTVDSQITAERIQADLIADDSTVVFNAATGQIAAAQLVGTFTGNVVGDTQGNHVGTVDGDLSGSVFADDSTLIIDAQNRRFTGTINGTTRMNTSDETEVQLTIESLENTSKINLRRQSASSLAGNTSLQYGTISFGREDTSGVLTTAIMFARENEFRIGQSSTGAFGTESVYITWKDNKLGLGKTNPAEQLDMTGNAIIDGFVQFGSLTTVERDALTAANGMVIYNSTDNKFQGYENGSWVNLI